ncbi:hypothetical protein T492DRAFT_850052 [Pavlovales sp. CCMP2436]|nr:hypothetical protein T492DRAFT_850052 [Pavlovales sp. CCMP2436]
MNDTDHQYAPAIPSFYDFSPRPPAVKSECIRAYITPTNGATFAPARPHSAIAYTTLDNSAACVLSQIDVFHGSRQLSSISEYNLLQQVLTNFSYGADDYKTSGTMQDVADYAPAAIMTAANFTHAYYARLGATIAPGAFLTVCIPLISILGSMSMRAWPISQAKENIRTVIKLADVLNYGKWSATPVGTCAIDNFKMWLSYLRIDPNVERKMVMDLGGVVSIPCVDFVQASTSVAAGSNYVSMPIAVRAKSATAIFVAIRKRQTWVLWNHAGAHARAGHAAFGVYGAHCFPMTEAMGDGLLVDSTIILEMNLGTAQTSAIRLDAFVQMEKTLVFANGAITFDA